MHFKCMPPPPRQARADPSCTLLLRPDACSDSDDTRKKHRLREAKDNVHITAAPGEDRKKWLCVPVPRSRKSTEVEESVSEMAAAVEGHEFERSRAGLDVASESPRDAENDEDRRHDSSGGDDEDLEHALEPSLSDPEKDAAAPHGQLDDVVVGGTIEPSPIGGVAPHVIDDATPDTSDTPPVAEGSGFSILPGGRGSASRKSGRPLLF